jgi:MFS family permease
VKARLSGRLWRNPDFLIFWTGETFSQVGAQVTQLALPLTAVYLLKVTSSQLGLLNAASFGPFLGFSLFIGAWVDRMRCRPLMIVSNIGRVLLVGSIPVLALLHAVHLGYLYAAALAIGVLTVLFNVSYQAYLPSLVDRANLVEANSKMQVTSSVAQIGGPSLAGLLIQLLSAPLALFANAGTYLLSLGTLAAIRRAEPAPDRSGQRRRLRREIADGLRFVFAHRYLRPCALQSGIYNLFWMSLQTLFLLYAARRLDLSAGTIGLILSTGALGALLGSLAASRVKSVLGLGRAILAEVALCSLAPFLIPLAAGPRPVVIGMFVVSIALEGVGATMANVHIISLRQTITPDAMLGRMNASYLFVSWGCLPLGGLLGGALGNVLGLRPGLFVTAAGFTIAIALIIFSPIPQLREMPAKPMAADYEPATEESVP